MIDTGIGNLEASGFQFAIGFSIHNYGLYEMNDRDDYYIVFPGYKLLVYEGSYSSRCINMDNTSGTKIEGYRCHIYNIGDFTNKGSSCKLFYKNVEIPYEHGLKVEVSRFESRYVKTLNELIVPPLGL
jgi:hypothetical protein